jgi:hypothetical protein
MLHKMCNLIDFWRFYEFIAGAKNDPDIKNGTTWRIDEEAPGAIFEPDLLD